MLCNTQKESFLQYLQKMDIGMLELILDNSITYFGVSKKIFLEKLSYIFNQVKLGGGRHIAYMSDTLFDDDLK